MASLISRSEPYGVCDLEYSGEYSLLFKSPKYWLNRLKACWDEILEETVHASCSQVPDRLRRVVKAKGGYIEN